MDWSPLKTVLVGIGGTGVVLGLFALAFMNPVAFARLASQVSGFVLDRLRALVEWGRDPNRNWWKVGCLTFAGFFTLAAFIAHDRHREVIVITERCAEAKSVLSGEKEKAVVLFTKARDGLAECQVALAREVGLPDDIEAMNAAAIAKLEADARKAKAEADEWRRRYNARPKDCTAALAVVEDRCGSLSGY